MTSFKEIITSDKYHRKTDFPSVSLSNGEQTLFLQFDSKDVLINASYTGSNSSWLNVLCDLGIGLTLQDLRNLSWENLEKKFGEEQIFWDLRQEKETEFFFKEYELFLGALGLFQGREYLYEEKAPLVCRCFGVREEDILSYLNKDDASLEGLIKETKAGMGCRSCLKQLKKFFVANENKKFKHYYKARPIADWLVQIDYQLQRFHLAKEWGMELRGMKGSIVTISYEADVSQLLEEKISQELQDFLAGAVDTGLAFFLRSARHFSKASG